MKRHLIALFVFATSTSFSYCQIDTNRIIEKAYNICLQEYFNNNNINTPSAKDWEKVTDTMYCSFKFLKQKGFKDVCFFYIDMKAAEIKKKFNRVGFDSCKFYFFSEVLLDNKYFACIGNGRIYKLGGFYENQVMEFFENYFLLESYHFQIRNDKFYRNRVIRKHLPFYKSLRKRYYVEELDIVNMIKFFKSTWKNKYYKSINRARYQY